MQEVTCEYANARVSTRVHLWIWWIPQGKFSTNLSPFGRIRQVHNTTSYHDFCTMNLNQIRISMVRGHAQYKYSPRNTMQNSSSTNSNPLRISRSDTSFSPTVADAWVHMWIRKCKSSQVKIANASVDAWIRKCKNVNARVHMWIWWTLASAWGHRWIRKCRNSRCEDRICMRW